jgi:hypothetical protein
MWLVEGLCSFLIAVFVATLVEYWVHRLMHLRCVLGRKHAEHHRDGWGQGVFGEFFDYSLGTLPILWIGFLYSVPAGIGFATGGIVYAVFAAYSHQVQHERPELVFWLKRPVHHLHHKHHMWHHNFGISLDVWDRVFGTYKTVEWNPERRPRDFPLRSFYQIHWFSQAPADAADRVREAAPSDPVAAAGAAVAHDGNDRPLREDQHAQGSKPLHKENQGQAG